MLAKNIFYSLMYRVGQQMPDDGISILCYHSVDDSGSRISISPALFRSHMRLLGDLGYQTISISEIIDRLRAGRPFEKRRVAITFDDGFENLYSCAAPIMHEYGFTGTTFIISGMIGKRIRWMNQDGALPHLPLMHWRQIRDLHAGGFEVGAHSITHRYLTQLPHDQLSHEIRASRQIIEEALSAAVDIFSYPYGDYNAAVIAEVVRAGYKGGCATIPTRLRCSDSPFELPRLFVARDATPVVLRAALNPGAAVGFRVLSVMRQGRAAQQPWYVPDPRSTDSTGTLPE